MPRLPSIPSFATPAGFTIDTARAGGFTVSCGGQVICTRPTADDALAVAKHYARHGRFPWEPKATVAPTGNVLTF